MGWNKYGSSTIPYFCPVQLKNISAASALTKKFKKAQEMEQTMRAAYDELTGTLHEDWIKEWAVIEQEALDRKRDALKLYTAQEAHGEQSMSCSMDVIY
jgi:hypothetical protein